jgi:hypothetical protein
MSISLTDKQTPQEKRTLVLKELKEQIENIKIIQKNEQENNDYQKEDDGLYREPLSFDKEETIRILLSWGGGEDGFKLTFKDKELLRGIYYCADWGQYEEVDLNEDELNKVFDFYLYGEYPENLN